MTADETLVDWNAQVYRQNTGFVSDLGIPVVELLNPQAGERILDLGCGDGELTLKLMECGCQVVGIDSSPSMIAAAKAKGVEACLMDAAEIEFNHDFDAVFSNAALHWMRPPELVIQGVYRVLKSGGRFVAETGPEGNIAIIRQALHRALESRGVSAEAVDPWYFPSSSQYSALLEEHGFKVTLVDQFDRPTPLPGGLAAWIDSVAHPFLQAISKDQRDEFKRDVEIDARDSLCNEKDEWFADYVRLRFIAVK